MTGMEAISAHNGWAISAIGVTIVFTGLTVLSLTISQLHKVLAFMERKKSDSQKRAEGAKEIDVSDIIIPGDMKETAREYKMIIDRMDAPFSLPRLLELSEKCGLNRPYSNLNDLIGSGLIEPDGEGYYRWKGPDNP